MVARPGFLGSLHPEGLRERDDTSGFGAGAPADRLPVRLDHPVGARSAASSGGPGFDPIWGTLSGPIPPVNDGWLGRENRLDGILQAVEVFGDGFQVSGHVRTGQFDRLSDWINMQTGFMQVQDAVLSHLGLPESPDSDQKGTLWVRLDQVVILADRSPVQASRPGAPIIRKQPLRVSILTPGYSLQGSIHVHANGSMAHFLEAPDPSFMPMTDLTLRWLSNPALVARIPFALVSRQQVVTILAESADDAHMARDAAAQASPFRVRSGAA